MGNKVSNEGNIKQETIRMGDLNRERRGWEG